LPAAAGVFRVPDKNFFARCVEVFEPGPDSNSIWLWPKACVGLNG